MKDLTVMEAAYKDCIKNMKQWSRDEVIQVDNQLLQQLNLLGEGAAVNDSPPYSFNFLESDDKVTLYNDRYVIWIVPENDNGKLVTYTLVALNKNTVPRLELVFLTSGIYNNSHLVLKLLEKFLDDIEENENALETLA